MFKDFLAMDEKDLHLLSALMRDPDISQQDLASLIGVSQPSVNVRLRKLRERGLLEKSAGINPFRAGLTLVRVDFTAADPVKIFSSLRDCPFFVNGFLMSGTRNASILLLAENLKKVELIVSDYLRSDPSVSNIDLSVVIDVTKRFVCELDLEKESFKACKSLQDCNGCPLKD